LGDNLSGSEVKCSAIRCMYKCITANLHYVQSTDLMEDCQNIKHIHKGLPSQDG